MGETPSHLNDRASNEWLTQVAAELVGGCTDCNRKRSWCEKPVTHGGMGTHREATALKASM